MIPKVCEGCGKAFAAIRDTTRYCSRQCFGKYGRVHPFRVPAAKAQVRPGDTFGLLTVIGVPFYLVKSKQYAVMQCECGTIKVVDVYSCKCVPPRTIACGCEKIRLASEYHTSHRCRKTCPICEAEFCAPPTGNAYCSTQCADIAVGRERHGGSNTRLYTVWRGMKDRCIGSPSERHKREYRDAGITVCQQWMSFVGFRDWALSHGYRDGNEIDRIDVHRGYEPENCRWVTETQQSANTRKRVSGVTSQYKGVSWDKKCKSWSARCRGVQVGRFADERSAAIAYDEYSRTLYGEHARFNFPRLGEQGALR